MPADEVTTRLPPDTRTGTEPLTTRLPPDTRTGTEPLTPDASEGEVTTRFPPDTPAGPEPGPGLAALRERAAVVPVSLPSGARAWLVTRHEDNRRFLADPVFSRAAAASAAAPRLRRVALEAASMTTMDPPEHTRIRRLVAQAFSRQSAERLWPRVERTADTLVADMAAAGPPADLVTGLARPLPFTVIRELLGVPDSDHALFHGWAAAHLEGTDEEAAGRLHGYLAGLVAAKREAPGDDLLSVLVNAREDDRLSERELAALGVTLLVAGYETVANLVAGSVQALLRHPGQLAALRARPELMDGAVEELLRYVPISVSGGTMRVATRPARLGGRSIAAGEAVLPATVSANRDARVFDEPDRLDLTRAPNPHLAFGHGPHRCLGAHLARVELRAALAALLRRMPDFRLAVPDDQVSWRVTGMLRGPEALPLAW
ncbi:cytochrome P450 [Sphaerisporangium sp. TRM90804]|uniref:cytochrome P450 n=1 Tax=Sphaerisporangium sp. TRM90804 TaxID=3031113 RepID=UPI002448C0BE|nr:cytochrome P450 [Sphaerisporangium sp. TRM90804]MDH2427206.1 cytochrome P450 [Sphaerisporangium sp. TRM90804]